MDKKAKAEAKRARRMERKRRAGEDESASLSSINQSDGGPNEDTPDHLSSDNPIESEIGVEK